MSPEKEYILLFMLYAKVVTAIMVIPIIIAALYFKKLNRPLKIFLSYLIVAFIVAFFMQLFIWATGAYRDYFTPILQKWKIRDTNFVSIFDYLSTFVLLGWYYSTIFIGKRITNFVKILSGVMILAVTIQNFYISDFREYNSFSATAYAIFSILLPLIHTRYVYKTLTEVSIRKNPYFWINIGLIVPNTIGLFLHITGNKLYDTDMILYFKISMAKYYFVIISNILFAIGFYYTRYTKFLPEKW